MSAYRLVAITIAGITLAAVGGVLLIRLQSHDVTGDATPRIVAVDRLRFAISDMNGAQNLYVVNGGATRAAYLAAEGRYRNALGYAEGLATAQSDQATLASIRRAGAAFQAIDRRVYADVAAGRSRRAAALVSGVETRNARAMDTGAEALLRSVTVRREHALSSLYRSETLVLLGLVGLGVVALLLSRWAIAERRRTETRFQHLVENMPAATFLVEPGGERRVVYVSPQAERITGISERRWLQPGSWRLVFELVPEGERERLMQRLAQASADGEEFELTVRLRGDDGRERWVTHHSSPVPGSPLRQGFWLDVTASTEAERRSHEALAALVTATEQEQSRIAAELHDDTVQVMTALLMTVRLALEDDERLARFEPMLAGALDRTRRLMFELRPELLERQGLAGALPELAAEGPWQQALVDVDVPRQSETTEALVYRTVRELIVNARKHSQAGTLEVRGHVEGGELVFEVEDDGVGFDVERVRDRDRMRMHIGLDTSAERVHIAGGRLTIDSSPGRGARFSLRLPAQPRDQAVRPEPARAAASRGGGRR
jgi:PAS domain S-box-containing protein